jgi:2',3'-cyclic-nucleotide 2'-phosphodiesterase (5'-nucleotidase family)
LKRVSAGGLSLAGIAALGSAQAASNADSDPLTIVHGTQFHGRFGSPKGPNVARYATVVDELREEFPNSALVATGDDVAKAPIATVLRGLHVVDAMNYLDPLAAVVGNHEFDYGDFILRRRMGASTFPWVSANLLAGPERAIPGARRGLIESVGDVTVGVFGLSLLEPAEYVYYPPGYRMVRATRTAKAAVARMERAGVDYVVCASHLRLEGSKEIARSVDGIDLMVGDHEEHVLSAPVEIGGTVVNSVGAEFGQVGRVTINGNGLRDSARVAVSPDVAPDPGMRRIVRKWRRRYGVQNPTDGDTIVSLAP